MAELSYTTVPFDPATNRFQSELALAPVKHPRSAPEPTIKIVLSQAKAGGPYLTADATYMGNRARCFGTWNGDAVTWQQLVAAVTAMFEVKRRN